MNRQHYLDLSSQNLRMPIGSDLTLRSKPDHDAILLDPRRLGSVLAETAARYGSPLAFPVMDLTLEKAAMLSLLGIAESADTFHFGTCPDDAMFDRLLDQLAKSALPARMKANAGAITYVKKETQLTPIGMSIGPFSLMTKLLADPITPVYSAGMGMSAEDDEEVKMIERVLEMSTRMTLASIKSQIEAGASAIFVAEPAASSAFFSPKQLEAGADIFQRYAINANKRVKALLDQHGVDLIFHCCGELVPDMVRAFGTLDPVILSLGSSRKMWEDAALVPANVVMYGNLPSKKFYSDDVITTTQVRDMSRDLLNQMQSTHHPFILGTECDVLSVPGCEHTIMTKVDAMMSA
jgi:uroporphyrinogen-III decarboxylase